MPTHRLTNKEIADILTNIGDLLKLQDANRFRVIAFQNAAKAIEDLGQSVANLHAQGKLTDIPGVGKGIAADISQLLENGQADVYESLKAEIPMGVVEMMRVPDVGPKTARRLWEERNITSVEALEVAAQAGELRDLKGMGEKSEAKILRGIELLRKRRDDRIPLGDARPVALNLVAELQAALPAGVIQKIEAAGSLRRWRETIGDMDILAVSDQPEAVMAAFGRLPMVAEVLSGGLGKSRVLLQNNMEVDLRVVEPQHWGAALQYFTGSKEHNVAVRELALKQGWSLNEYGLTATDRNLKTPAGSEQFFETEEALYDFLGLAWTPPELRENTGEVTLAQKQALPALITLDQIQGELHGHSIYSDGVAPIAEMAAAAMQRGYRYWAVCDHSIGLGMVGGVDGEGLARQAAEIADLNQRYAAEGRDFRLLRGIEVEILADGSLGLPDEVLAQLEVVVASIHSGLRQDQATITARCLRAVANPHVDILGHPTGRLLGRRSPSELDLEAVLAACAEKGTAVEINAHPSRLDLQDTYARRAAALGVRIAINSDAHAVDGMQIMPYGIATARRGWLTSEHILNSRPAEDVLALLKR